jgi:uncharacterized membrane protein (UPF0127 family)
VKLADGFLLRLKGLLFTKSLPSGQALYLSPCQQIHMFGMAYALDALFLSKDGKVIGLVENLKPWRMSAMHLKATGCLELPAGTISNTKTRVGDQVVIE